MWPLRVSKGHLISKMYLPCKLCLIFTLNPQFFWGCIQKANQHQQKIDARSGKNWIKIVFTKELYNSAKM